MSLKNRITFTILLSSFGIVLVLLILYKYINHIIVLQEVAKARLESKTIYYYREYLAKVSPNVLVKDKNLSYFSCTPAYATNQVAKLIRDKEHFYIRQVSDRWRSPYDKPNTYELKAIDFFKTHPKAREFWEIHNPHKNITMGGNLKHIFYAYPLYIEKSCLVCHGDPKKDVPPNLYKILLKEYGNRAFYYKLGELRGIISLRLPYQQVQDKILSVFLVISTILFIAFLIGTFIFVKLSKNITDDIDKILQFFRNKIANNDYSIIRKKMNFIEFEKLKEEINKTIRTIKEYQEKLKRNPITKLPNRMQFFEFIEKNKKPIMVVNVDKFREINSYFNTEVGDELIKEIAKRLKKLRRKYNIKIFHLDIDEFGIVPLGINENRDSIKKLTEEILKELEEPYFIFNNEILVRFRMGISFQKKEYLRAEMALNKAKELKKDIVFGSDAIENKENYGEHIKWLKKLKNAIDNDRIVPFFQPIYDKNEKIVKYEALVRMIDEDGKVISPFFFLDVAKKSRLYLEITKIMLSKSLRTIRDNKVSISINITLEDMEDEEMRDFIINKIEECIYKDKVTFEIVENEDIRESEIIKEFLDSLRAKGVSLYIDDFGSGYANFDYLLKLHPEGVKIDGSLIKNILNDKNSQVMVKTLINFAKESEIFIVAEFVENREIFEMLRDMGVDYFQGYYFSPPKSDIER